MKILSEMYLWTKKSHYIMEVYGSAVIVMRVVSSVVMIGVHPSLQPIFRIQNLVTCNVATMTLFYIDLLIGYAQLLAVVGYSWNGHELPVLLQPKCIIDSVALLGDSFLFFFLFL